MRYLAGFIAYLSIPAYVALTILSPVPASPVEAGEQAEESDEPPSIQPVYGPEKPEQRHSLEGNDPDSVRRFIERTAREMGVSPSLAVAVASCESGFRPMAQNPTSSAYGTFQFINSTWRIAATEAGLDPASFRDDPEAQVIVGVNYMKDHGVSAWSASKHCWER